MTDARAPHKAVCLLSIEVHSILPSGECSGKLVTKAELSEFNIKPKVVVSVSGFSKKDCLNKLRKAIDEFGKAPV